MAISSSAGSAQVPIVYARRLLRAARAASLATAGPGGQPFASLVAPAMAPEGVIVLLLSDLSEHTGHLESDRRCALLVVGEPEGVNPQGAPRVTVTGFADPVNEPALAARYLAVHPYAASYAGLPEFRFWRVQPLGGVLAGGFGESGKMRAADFLPLPGVVAAIAAAEPAIITSYNEASPDALARIAGAPGAWRLVGVDVDGCDLAQGEIARRVHWSQPAGSAQDVRSELARLARG